MLAHASMLRTHTHALTLFFPQGKIKTNFMLLCEIKIIVRSGIQKAPAALRDSSCSVDELAISIATEKSL